MSVKKILDPRNLPYAGAFVQGILFAIAGNAFFPILGWLAGLGVGMVVNYSIALASSRISDISEKRKPLARAALGVMFVSQNSANAHARSCKHRPISIDKSLLIKAK